MRPALPPAGARLDDVPSSKAALNAAIVDHEETISTTMTEHWKFSTERGYMCNFMDTLHIFECWSGI